MKFRWDKKYLYWGLTAFLVIIASMSFFLALFRLDEVGKVLSLLISVAQPILYGLVIAYLLMPMMNFFENQFMKLLLKERKVVVKQNRKSIKINVGKIARASAIIVTLIINTLALIGLFSMVIPQLIESIIGIVNNFDSYGDTIKGFIDKTMADNPNLETQALAIYDRLNDYIKKWVDNDVIPQLNTFLVGLTSGVLGAFIVVKDILIGVIISVYVMASKDIFSAQAKKLLYAIMKAENANSIIKTTRRTHKIFGGFISGKLLDSLIIGILSIICLSIIDMPYALLISVIIGITNIIPFFGPFIGAVPSAILILLVDPIKCIYFIIFIIILQQFDGNILGPKILGDSTGLSSFWVMFAILVSGGLFGFMGMVLGVPLFAVIYSLISDAISKSLKEKKLPINTDEYRNLKYIDEKSHDFVLQRYTLVNKISKDDVKKIEEAESELGCE